MNIQMNCGGILKLPMKEFAKEKSLPIFNVRSSEEDFYGPGMEATIKHRCAVPRTYGRDRTLVLEVLHSTLRRIRFN